MLLFGGFVRSFIQAENTWVKRPLPWIRLLRRYAAQRTVVLLVAMVSNTEH